MSNLDPVQSVLDRLEDARQTGQNQWQARCPAHDDSHASLSIGQGDAGKVLLYCHVCGKEATPAIVESIGLTMSDLDPPEHGVPPLIPHKPKPPPPPVRTPQPPPIVPPPPAIKAMKGKPSYRTAEEAFAAAGRQAKGQLAMDPWKYPGDSFRVARFALADGDKTFRPIHRNATGWAIGDPSGLLPLYRGDDLPATGPIIVTEGEKCADAARRVGLAAVTSAHGCGSAHKTDWRPLAGREIIILPDNDKGGRKYAQEVGAILCKLTPPAVVKIVELPGLADGGDIADWIADDGPMGSKSPDEIKAAVLDMANSAKPFTPLPVKSLEGEPVITCLADVKPTPLTWLWEWRIPLGKVTMLVGNPSVGKSFVTLDMASRITTGTAFPDCPHVRNAPGGVVLLSAEDDAADTIVPRLLAAGADLKRIVKLDAIRVNDRERSFNLEADLSALERAIIQVGDCRLVVIDPITAYLGKADGHKNSEIRGLLAPLSALAARHGVAVIGVNHLRKGEGPAMYRAMGSLAFVAVARAVYCVARDKHDVTGKRRLFLPMKSNLSEDGDGLAYSLDETFSANGQPVVKWETAPVSISADEALSDDGGWHGDDDDDSDTSELEEAKTWLADMLANGPMAAKEIHKQATQDRISPSTLNRAKKDLGVKAHKAKGVAHGAWSWSMGEGCQQERQAPGQENLGNVGNLGNLGKTPNENADSQNPKIEDCQECQGKASAITSASAPLTPAAPRTAKAP
jgi:hypothetical protein